MSTWENRNTVSEDVAQPAPQGAQFAPLSSRRKTWIALSGALPVVMVVIGIIVAVNSGGGSSGNAGNTSAADSTQQPIQSTNDKCALDAYNAAADITANGDAGLMREVSVGGRENPVFNIALQVRTTFMSNLYAVGKQAASGAAMAKAKELCLAQGDPNNDAFGGTPYEAPSDTGSSS